MIFQLAKRGSCRPNGRVATGRRAPRRTREADTLLKDGYQRGYVKDLCRPGEAYLKEQIVVLKKR
jgi:hypothetical protein